MGDEGSIVEFKPTEKKLAAYREEQVHLLEEKLRELETAHFDVRFKLLRLAERLQVPRAKTFANEGLGRRLTLIARAAQNIYEIYPPDRSAFLDSDECADIAINFHAFIINLYAMFDNIAWVVILEAGQQLEPMKIGPYSKKALAFFPKRLQDYLEQPTVKSWYDQYGKLYRDSTAHRIAPYLPQRAYNTTEGKCIEELRAQSMQMLLEANSQASPHEKNVQLDKRQELENQIEALGRNSLLMLLSLTAEDALPPIYIHQQLLCDWGLAHELVLEFITAINAHHGP